MKIRRELVRVYTNHLALGLCNRVRFLWRRPRICVIILTKSSESDSLLRRVIDAYRANKSTIHFCVVESGSSTISVDVNYYLRPEFDFHYNKYIQYALSKLDLNNYDAVVISNDDVIPLPNALDILAESGFDSCSPVDPTVVRTKGLWRTVVGYEIEYHLCGWCLFVSTKILGKYGIDNLFHDRYYFYLQDVYYAKLLKALGVPHAVVPRSKVIHLEHQSVEKAQLDLLKYDHLIQHLDTDVDATVRAILHRTKLQ